MPASVPPPQELVISLVGTNDLHGYVEPRYLFVRDHAGAVHKVGRGGLVLLAGYLNNLRRRHPVLLLDAGDMFQGTMVSNLGEGQAVIDAYNVIGYHAAAIGNHDFDFGPLGPHSVPHAGTGDDATGALKTRIAAAHFPFLSANLLDKKTGQPVRWLNTYQSQKLDIAGVPIGVIGATTEDTPHTTYPLNLRDLIIAPMVPAVKAQAQALRQQGVAAVVLTVHEGADCQLLNNPRDASSCYNAREHILAIVRALGDAVDAVVAGHVHAGIAHFVGDVPIIESYSKGQWFGRIDLTFQKVAGRWALDKKKTHIFPPTELCEVAVPKAAGAVDAPDAAPGEAAQEATPAAAGPSELPPFSEQLIRRCSETQLNGTHLRPAEYEGRPVVADAAVLAALQPHIARAAALRAMLIGVTTRAPIHRRSSSNQEPTLTMLMADLLRSGAEEVSGEPVDFAIQNRSGLRNGLPAGPLTYGDIFEVMPFDNRLAILRMTGVQLTELYRHNLQTTGMLVPSGLMVEARCAGTGLEVTLRDNAGNPLLADHVYRVAVTDFLATGGDAFSTVIPKLPAGAVTLYDDVLQRELVLEQLRKYRGPLPPEQEPPPRLRLPTPIPVHCQ